MVVDRRFGVAVGRGGRSACGAEGGEGQVCQAQGGPAVVAKARELRDRWLEEVNAGRAVLGATAKYDASRALPATMLHALPDAA